MNVPSFRVLCIQLIICATALLVGAGPAVCASPTRAIPRLTGEQESPVICVFGDVDLKTEVIVAAWEDGRVIWSDDPIDGGRPYREAMRTPEEITSVLTQISGQQLMVAAENPCPRKDQLGDLAETTFHVVQNGVSLLASTRHIRLEAAGSSVYTSSGPRLRNGQTLEAILANESACFLAFRSRIDTLNSTCLSLIPGDATSYPVKVCRFEMRSPGETPSGAIPTPTVPKAGYQWAPTSADPRFSLSCSARPDSPAVWIASVDGPSRKIAGVDALYADGTFIWLAAFENSTNSRMVSLGPGAVAGLLSSLNSEPVFGTGEVSLLRAYNPDLRQVLTYLDSGNTVRQIISSHDYIEERIEGFRQGLDGPASLYRKESPEEWLDGQPEAYRQFRLSWARVKDGLRALRPTDPAQSTALGEVTWTLTPIVPPTPSPTP